MLLVLLMSLGIQSFDDPTAERGAQVSAGRGILLHHFSEAWEPAMKDLRMLSFTSSSTYISFYLKPGRSSFPSRDLGRQRHEVFSVSSTGWFLLDIKDRYLPITSPSQQCLMLHHKGESRNL